MPTGSLGLGGRSHMRLEDRSVFLSDLVLQRNWPAGTHRFPSIATEHLLEASQNLDIVVTNDNQLDTTCNMGRDIYTLRNISSSSAEGVCHFTTALQNQKKSYRMSR